MEERSEIRNLVEKFLDQSKTGELKKASYIKTYRGLTVAIGFGQGAPAAVPWIGFLHPTQKPRVGIYPVFLYFKSHDILILAYGVGAGWEPRVKWRLPPGVKTIREYMSENSLPNLKYNESFVYRVYKPNAIDWNALAKDVNGIINEYQEQVG